jgi:hypothetical protein
MRNVVDWSQPGKIACQGSALRGEQAMPIVSLARIWHDVSIGSQ